MEEAVGLRRQTVRGFAGGRRLSGWFNQVGGKPWRERLHTGCTEP